MRRAVAMGLMLIFWMGTAAWAEIAVAMSNTPVQQESRIINGDTVADGKNFWIVGVFNYNFTKGGQLSSVGICTGSLVGDRWVLTAKHCIDDYYPNAVYKPEEIVVFYGSHTLDTSKLKFASVEKLRYSAGYDIALIKLKSPISVTPVKMLTLSESSKYEKIGQIAGVAGWGWTNEYFKLSPSSLQFTAIPLRKSSDCGIYSQNEICAGYYPYLVTTGPCHGDSGGPLFVVDEITNEIKLMGIVNDGIGSCGTLSTYAKVSSFYDSVVKIMNEADTTVSNANTTTSASIELVGTQNIGWYFWTIPSGYALLASEGQNGVSVWNFTSDRKWMPLHNAAAFDGYPAAGNNFSSVYFSSDHTKITLSSITSSSTYNIGWYFWMMPSGNAFLASQGQSGVSVWSFTSDRKWQPVHNAGTFDGYPAAGNIFSNVYFSSDHKQIIFTK